MGCGPSSETIDSGRASRNDTPQLSVPHEYDWRSNGEQRYPEQQSGGALVNNTGQPRQGSSSGHREESDTGRFDASIAEQVALIDNAAKVFHTLSEHQRTIMMELAAYQNEEATSQRLDETVTSAFNTVLQFCEAVTAIIVRGEIVDEPSKMIAMFSNTTISFMTVKTIIDMYDLVLLRSEDSLWLSSTKDPERIDLTQDTRASGGLMNDSSCYGTRNALKIHERLETMDFHIAHIEAVCRRLRDVSWLIIQATCQSNTPDDVSNPQLSQNEVIEKMLKAALSTRQQIARLRTKINSTPST